MEYLESRRLIHRDVACRNVFLTSSSQVCYSKSQRMLCFVFFSKYLMNYTWFAFIFILKKPVDKKKQSFRIP